MSAKDIILETLESNPAFRERSRKDNGLVILLARKHALTIGVALTANLFTRDDLIAFVQDYATYDRAWRQALERNPALRGSDYDSKDELEAKKMEELGYNVPPTTP